MNKKFSLYPQNEKDYFRIWKWQVSKRLIITAIIMAGIASFLYVVSYMHNGSVNGEKSNIYKYNSLILPYINGKVKIKASSGYIAYEGEVEGGSVSGIGTLYGSDGHIIYNGEFEENQYSGGGRLYDDDGNLMYDGEFRDNLYEGEGVEYFDGGQYERTPAEIMCIQEIFQTDILYIRIFWENQQSRQGKCIRGREKFIMILLIL